MQFNTLKITLLLISDGWGLKNLSSKSYMDHYETVESVELNNVRIMHARFSKELELFRCNFNLLAETLRSIINKLKVLKVRDFAVVIVSSKLLLSSKAILNLEMNGYDYEARVIMRTMLEDLLRIICFVRDEKMAQKWLKGKLQASEVKSFVHDLFFNENSKELYNELSDFVHTNPKGLGSLVDKKEPGVRISPLLPDSYEEQMANIGLPTLYLILLLNVIKDAYNEKIEPPLMNKISKSIEHTLLHFKTLLKI